MKIKFEAKKGQRLTKGFIGFEPVNYDWMWNCDLKEWTQELEVGKYEYSSSRPCKSLKAFKRMLKNAPKNVKFRLWNKYIGYDVYCYA